MDATQRQPPGLKLLVDFASPRYAVVDVGTNSVKFVLGERQADGSWEHSSSVRR